jgi:hypothetical protein
MAVAVTMPGEMSQIREEPPVKGETVLANAAIVESTQKYPVFLLI